MNNRRYLTLAAAGLLLLSCSLFNALTRPRSGSDATITSTPSIAPASPTLTATSTPTPTPTPIPAVRIELGDISRMHGDWERSLQQYQTALGTSDDPQVKSSALLGIGRAQYQAGEYENALQTFLNIIQTYPDAASLPYAYFSLAQTYNALGRYAEAADAYGQYLALRPGLVDAYVLNLRGDALVAAGDLAAAIRDFRNAIQHPSLLNSILIEIKIAKAHAALGDYETALGMYQDIYNRAQTDYTKAQMDYFIGQTYAQLGQTEQAYAAYQDAVTNFPATDSAYLSLLELVNAGVPVDELQRGIVDYYAGQYGVAWAAFDRYFRIPGADPGTARYFNGLTLRALGGYAEAISEWETLIQNYPENPYWDDAWEKKAEAQFSNLGDSSGAIQTLLDFVANAPAHPRAGELLFRAAQYAEREGRLAQAAQIWERLASEQPEHQLAQRALFLAGIAHYRLGDYPRALSVLQRYLESAATLEDRAAAHFWQGKAQNALGDASAAAKSWEIAASIDPTGYYSERANDLLRGHSPFTPPENYDLAIDLVSERIQAEAWLRSTFGIAEEVDLSTPDPLMANPAFQRGTELMALGLYEQAIAELEAVRQAVATDPANSYRLANYLLEAGLYRSAIFAARQVLNLAGMGDMETLNAPIYFNHIRFGLYFSDLVLPAAHQYQIHPLLLFSIIRQESAFEGVARSSAGARGLMQIIPSTGAEIAAHLGWPQNYTERDLDRPSVNLVYGASYLAKWRDYFGGDLYAALAAYNGGPGNAIAWKKLAPDDPDLFLEVIRFEETRDYIRRIYENFKIYYRLYNRTP